MAPCDLIRWSGQQCTRKARLHALTGLKCELAGGAKVI